MVGREFFFDMPGLFTSNGVEPISHDRLLQGWQRYQELYKKGHLKETIDQLYADLGEIFFSRDIGQWEPSADSSFITRSMIKGVRTRRTMTQSEAAHLKRNDYAVSLLVDVSESMQENGKISETVKGAIVLAEVLNKLKIKTEILGFNGRLFQYKGFGESMTDEIRARIGTMESQTEIAGCENTDQGYAVEQAAMRLAGQYTQVKTLFVLTDGQPVPLQHHEKSHELQSVLSRLSEYPNTSKIIILGIGLGKKTNYVKKYYHLNLSNVNVSQMGKKLGRMLRVVIDVPDMLY